MIKPITCVCMVLAAGSGLYLYQSKHRAQLLDREIQRVLKQIDTVKERTGALTSEWAVLQESDRLTELSQKHLGLRQLAPTQFVSLAEAASRLPAPVAPGTMVAAPEERPAASPAPAMATAAAPVQTVPVQVAEARTPTPPRPAPRAVPMAAPVAAPAAVPVAPPPPAPRPVLASVLPVAVAPIVARLAVVPRTPATTPLAAPAPGSIGEAVLRAGIIKTPASVAPAAPAMVAMPAAAPAVSYAAPAYAMPTYQPAAGSALGSAGRAALPPPTPYSAR